MSVSSTAVLASAICTLAGTVFGQAQNVSQSNQGMNFYVTTPQTGEVVGSDGSEASSVQVATANARPAVNTYISRQTGPSVSIPQTGSREPASVQQGYSIQQVSNSPATLQGRATQAHQTGSTTRSPRVAATAQDRHAVVATSARATNFYTSSASQQQSHANAAYVSNAGAAPAKRGILDRIIHPGHSHKQQPAPTTTAASKSLNVKPSSLSGKMQQGMASWYGPKWHGRKTASGERFDMNSMTAAHKTLPFGTIVKVKNERNGRECLVRINNRGPFTKGRILDLSKAAASQIGMVGSGVARVTCEVVGRS